MFAGSVRHVGAGIRDTAADSFVGGVHPSFLEHAASMPSVTAPRTEILVWAGRPSLPEDRRDQLPLSAVGLAAKN